MVSARYALYTKRTTGKAVCIKSLPPMDANLSYHILRTHCQVMLWKATDQLTAGAECVPNPRIAAPAAHVAVILKDCHAHTIL